jgi:putative transposase
VVAPYYPHHIIQRGNRRQQTFFSDDDYRLYLDLMAEWCKKHNVAIWAYCLMPNHVHIIAVPQNKDGLRRAIGEAHRRYTRAVNFRMGWRGHLWQGRFSSYPMDESYLLAAARYIELNPVKAGIVDRAELYPWSSALFHVARKEDGLVSSSLLEEMVPDWQTFLQDGNDKNQAEEMERAERTGRPVGSSSFLNKLQDTLGRDISRKKPGPKSR